VPRGRWLQLTIARLAALIVMLGLLSIVSTAYTNLNGDHTWRQSDVYAQVLGMLGQRGLEPLGHFNGPPVMYDVPLYQALVAVLSMATRGEPLLVVRLVNAGLWIAFMWAIYRVAESLAPRAGFIVVALVTASPLFRHYFSVPLPDNLALALAACGLLLALEGRRWWVATSCFVVAALVKSPVPFVLLVFLAVWVLLSRSWRKRSRRLLVLYGASLLAALSAELIRLIATPAIDGEKVSFFAPAWYFGTLSDRFSIETWSTAARRTIVAFPTTSNVTMVLLAGLILAAFLWVSRESWKVAVATAAGFLSGWLVFTSVYVHHNYYGMPAELMVFLAISVIIASVVPKLPRAGSLTPWLMVAAVLVSMVYGPQNGDPRVTSFGDVALFAMADRSEFLYASDESDVGPQMGGVAATRMVIVSLEQLDQQCDSLLRRYGAVIARGPSACLMSHRGEAATYVTHADMTGRSPTHLTLWERD
jgi:hypothetical protein